MASGGDSRPYSTAVSWRRRPSAKRATATTGSRVPSGCVWLCCPKARDEGAIAAPHDEQPRAKPKAPQISLIRSGLSIATLRPR